jgi:hypothetical protein
MAGVVVLMLTSQRLFDICLEIPTWAWGIVLCLGSVRYFLNAQRFEEVASGLDSMESPFGSPGHTISAAISHLHECGAQQGAA